MTRTALRRAVRDALDAYHAVLATDTEAKSAAQVRLEEAKDALAKHQARAEQVLRSPDERTAQHRGGSGRTR